MKTKRREFIKLAGLTGAGVIAGCSRQAKSSEPFPGNHRQSLNMSGYAAPKLETVRVGIIGIGNRGRSMARAFTRIEGVEIIALSDIDAARSNAAIESIKASSDNNPASYSGTEDAWKKLCERGDIDLVYICTPWHLHTPMAVYAMEHEKHAAAERPIAVTIDECWQLVETSERTLRHCCNMTQSSHGGMSAIALNMVRKGYFGEVIHGEGCYIHELSNSQYLYSKTHFHDMWRLKENASRNGNLYSDSGIDTVAQIMDINCGDKIEYMVSLSSDDFVMKNQVKELASADQLFEPYVNMPFRGNMNISLLRTQKGRSIMIQHDTSSPRPRPGNLDLVSGTKGICMYSGRSPAIATSHHGWATEDEFGSLVEEYTPEIVKRFDELTRQNPSSGVRPMDWRLIDCLRNGLPLEMSLYDGVLYSAISPLSEWSVANGSSPVKVPDFTCGAWKTNKRGMDVELLQGGNTKII